VVPATSWRAWGPPPLPIDLPHIPPPADQLRQEPGIEWYFNRSNLKLKWMTDISWLGAPYYCCHGEEGIIGQWQSGRVWFCVHSCHPTTQLRANQHGNIATTWLVFMSVLPLQRLLGCSLLSALLTEFASCNSHLSLPIDFHIQAKNLMQVRGSVVSIILCHLCHPRVTSCWRYFISQYKFSNATLPLVTMMSSSPLS